MGAPRRSFRRALEAEIRRAAVEEEKFYIHRRDVEELGRSVGLPEEEAVRRFLHLAGDVWAGGIWLSEGPEIRLYGPPQRRIDPEWPTAWFDLPWMQKSGKIPYGDQLDG